MLFTVESCLPTFGCLIAKRLNSILNEKMKKLNEAQFLHIKPQTCDNEFHAPIFFALLENTPLPLFFTLTY